MQPQNFGYSHKAVTPDWAETKAPFCPIHPTVRLTEVQDYCKTRVGRCSACGDVLVSIGSDTKSQPALRDYYSAAKASLRTQDVVSTEAAHLRRQVLQNEVRRLRSAILHQHRLRLLDVKRELGRC